MKKKAFTLIEVIIAVSIVVILASLSIPKLTGYLDKAKDSKAISIGKQIYTAAMWSYSENGNSFIGQNVLDAIEDTTNIKNLTYNAAGNSSIVITESSKKVSVSFTSDSKNYSIVIDGNNNSYTITNESKDPDNPIFSSI